jgi:hypothetical protein
MLNICLPFLPLTKRPLETLNITFMTRNICDKLIMGTILLVEYYWGLWEISRNKLWGCPLIGLKKN